jgi:hypothetical protein
MLKTVAITSGSGGGNGTVTNVATGTGLTGGPITTTGTIALANTTVAAGTYGNASTVAQVTINAQGQATNVVNVAISIANSAVTGLGTMATQNANAVVVTGGSINNTAIGNATANTGVFTTLTSTGRLQVQSAATIGSATDGASQFAVLLGTSFSPGSAWNNSAATFGGIAATGSSAAGAVGVAFDATNGGWIACVAPGQGYYNLRYDAQQHNFFTTGSRQFQVNNTGSSVNYVVLTGAATNTSPIISVAGSDANVSFTITTKGTGIVQTAATLKYAGVISGLTTKTANYTLVATDHTVLGNATTASFSLTLPTSVGATGQVYIIKKVDSTANTVTILTTSSQTIDGSSSKVLSYQYDGFQLQSDGANWMIIGNIFGRNGTTGTF